MRHKLDKVVESKNIISYEKVVDVFKSGKNLFNEGKIIMPFFGQYYDITDKKALKYLQWNSGSSVANIVLYPLKKYDDNPLLFQTRLINEAI